MPITSYNRTSRVRVLRKERARWKKRRRKPAPDPPRDPYLPRRAAPDHSHNGQVRTKHTAPRDTPRLQFILECLLSGPFDPLSLVLLEVRPVCPGFAASGRQRTRRRTAGPREWPP